MKTTAAVATHDIGSVIYYLPGYGGRLDTGLGQAFLERGVNVTGRETVAEFRYLPFEEQVDVIREDLTQHFWHPQARVVASSFGAYLFLHGQMGMATFPGRVLLLSPIVGNFENHDSGLAFEPPYGERLQSRLFGMPADCEIHVGELDWQSVPSAVHALGQRLGVPVTVVPGKGHMLGESYVGPLLDRWLSAGASS